MAIVRTKSSRDQVWMDLPGPLPFGIRLAPAPLPVLPRVNTREYFDASLPVRRACWEVEEAEAKALGDAMIAACARWQEAEDRAAAEPFPVPVPVTPAAPALVNTAEAFGISALARMLAPGSLPTMYRRVVSARWTAPPKPNGADRLEAVLRFEMWDGLRGDCRVQAYARGLRYPRKTGDVDSFGEHVEIMVTSPVTWLSMGWDRMEGGSCVWEPKAGAWRRCKAETEVPA